MFESLRITCGLHKTPQGLVIPGHHLFDRERWVGVFVTRERATADIEIIIKRLRDPETEDTFV